MKKIMLILLIPSLFFAKIDNLSPIPPAEEIYINLEPDFCDTNCLLQLFDNGLYHSLLARFEGQNDEKIAQAFAQITGKKAVINFEPHEKSNFDLAVIMPEQSIKSYAKVVSNAVIAYVIKQKAKIRVKFYNIGNESFQNIQNALKMAQDEQINYIIAPFTPIGIEILSQNLENSQIAYVPTLHRSNVINSNQNIIFGGIDYKAQVSKLLEFSNANLAAFSDGSQLGDTINGFVKELGGELIYENEIKGTQNDLKSYISKRLNNATIFLNLPILKAALLSSQLRVYDVNPAVLLSTQINYSPDIFKLTQNEDRRNFYIANSLSDVDIGLGSNNKILDQDINYNWIGYSTSVGIDYLYTKFINPNTNRIFNQGIENSQIIYDTKVMKAGDFKFSQAVLQTNE
ncbi:MAG: hypothetical protein ACTTJC_00175 [Campylobacter sp.]